MTEPRREDPARGGVGVTANEEAVAALRQIEEGLRQRGEFGLANRLDAAIERVAAALTQAQQKLEQAGIDRGDARGVIEAQRQRIAELEAQAQESDDLAKIAADGNEREKALEAQAQQMEEALRRIERLDDGRGSTIARMALSPVPPAGEGTD